MITPTELKDLERFDFKHDITAYQKAAMGLLREEGKRLAKIIFENVPNCADRSAAIRYLRLAIMQCNNAVVHEGTP